MHHRSASRGVCIRGGGGRTPPGILRDMVNERALRIILECILVFKGHSFRILVCFMIRICTILLFFSVKIINVIGICHGQQIDKKLKLVSTLENKNKQECRLLGGVCPGGCLSGGCLPRGCLPRGCLPWGVSAPVHAGIHTPPVNRMTDRYLWKYYLAATSLQAVTKTYMLNRGFLRLPKLALLAFSYCLDISMS